MKPQSTVDLSTESETTFLTKPDAAHSVGGCLFGVCRDEKAPKIAPGNTQLTASSLVGLISDRSFCGKGLPNACDCQNSVNDCLYDTSFSQIIDAIESLRLDLENIGRNATDVSKLDDPIMDDTRLHSYRNSNFKSPPPKLSLAPNFQLTKVTKVSGPPLSPLPASLPCSPVPNRSPVKLKPDLPYHLSLNRKNEKSDKCTQDGDAESSDLEEIRDILSRLDLNKYKRRKAPEGCADSKSEKPSFCRSISNLYPVSSTTEHCPNPSNPPRTKLKELTELLNKNKGSRENGGDAFLNRKSSEKQIEHKFNKQSISVPESFSVETKAHSNSGMCTIKLQPLTGSATLPRRRVSPPHSVPLSSPRNSSTSTLNALSLAAPATAVLNNNDATQNKESRSYYNGSKFPLPPPAAKERDIKENASRPRANTETALGVKRAELKMFNPVSERKQIAVKPLNFMFTDAGKKQAANNGLSKKNEEMQLTPASSVNQCLSLVPVLPSISKLTVPTSTQRTEMSAPEENKPTLQQRRYYKKKLRGPYGEMLEEEMKKSESKPKTNHSREFQIVKELCQLQNDLQVSLYSSSQSLDESRTDTPDSECHSIKASDIRTETGNQNQLALRGIPSESNLSDQRNGLTNRVLAISERPFQSNLPEETRTHIVRELHCTEKSYVESLEILVNKYMKALKCSDYLETSLVDEIFYQVPRILEHHLKFLETLEQRIDSWHSTQTVGDIFTTTFSQKNLIEIYTAFINNWRSAKKCIKAAMHMKPAFGRFLEHMSREHKGKLTIDALLIMPVQRIPRYELLIKELLKNTSEDHPDYHLLNLAQREVHELAMKINQVERETVHLEQTLQKLKEIDNLIDGAVDLIQPERVFICYALVTIPIGFGIKKDRGLFLFSDLLLITSIKRKSGTGRKSSSPTNNPISFESLEANKYKLLTKVSLENLDIVKNTYNDSLERKVLSDIDHLEEDLSILGRISDLLSTVTTSHQILDDALQELQSNVSKQLVERQTGDTQLLTLELNAMTDEGVEKLTIIFPTCEKRISWENSFVEAKQKYTHSSKNTRLPEFLYYLPVRKTRAGLQFACAAPTLGINQYGYKDVWVCNSDGYVGQVCILTLHPEPSITSCNGICNSRILCILSAPEYSCLHASEPCYNYKPINDHVTEIGNSTKRDSLKKANNGKIHLEGDSSEEEEDIFDKNDRLLREKENGGALCIQESSDRENHQSTMWLGTEDGCILVYSCSDNIRIKKTKTKLQHSSSVCSITYLDDQIFASLASGELVVYSRKESGTWNFDDPTKFSVGSNMCPINQMLGVNGKLWCAYQNYVKVLNCDTLKVEHTFQVSNDPSKSVIAMVLSGFGVWISLKYSPVILLYHATSCEYLLDVSVVPAVSKILAGCDDIIQQHKSACLRITSLLICKDLLWIGTSAGVVLTMTLSSVTSIFNCTDNINIFGVSQGHTGHVRFLTCVETSIERHNSYDSALSNDSALSSIETIAGSTSNKILVISGGDGYEDFQYGYREAAGHDDSTNHLLLWHV